MEETERRVGGKIEKFSFSLLSSCYPDHLERHDQGHPKPIDYNMSLMIAKLIPQNTSYDIHVPQLSEADIELQWDINDLGSVEQRQNKF